MKKVICILVTLVFASTVMGQFVINSDTKFDSTEVCFEHKITYPKEIKTVKCRTTVYYDSTTIAFKCGHTRQRYRWEANYNYTHKSFCIYNPNFQRIMSNHSDDVVCKDGMYIIDISNLSNGDYTIHLDCECGCVAVINFKIDKKS